MDLNQLKNTVAITEKALWMKVDWLIQGTGLDIAPVSEWKG